MGWRGGRSERASKEDGPRTTEGVSLSLFFDHETSHHHLKEQQGWSTAVKAAALRIHLIIDRSSELFRQRINDRICGAVLLPCQLSTDCHAAPCRRQRVHQGAWHRLHGDWRWRTDWRHRHDDYRSGFGHDTCSHPQRPAHARDGSPAERSVACRDARAVHRQADNDHAAA